MTEQILVPIGVVTAVLLFAAAWIQYSGLLIGLRRKVSRLPKAPAFKLIQLKIEPVRKHHWKHVKTIMLLSASLVLVPVGLFCYAWMVVGRITIGDIPWLIFILFFVGLAISMIVDVFKVNSRVRDGLKSRVAKRADILVEADYESLVRRCQESLADMGARLTEADAETGLLGALLGGEELTIRIAEAEENRYLVQVESDSTLPTVRFDGGRNLRNFSGVVQRLLDLQ